MTPKIITIITEDKSVEKLRKLLEIGPRVSHKHKSFKDFDLSFPQDSEDSDLKYNEFVKTVLVAGYKKLINISSDNLKLGEKPPLPVSFESSSDLKIIWEFSYPEKIEKLDSYPITSRAIQLASKLSTEAILKNLIEAFPFFSPSQKYYFYLMIWQLIALSIIPQKEFPLVSNLIKGQEEEKVYILFESLLRSIEQLMPQTQLIENQPLDFPSYVEKALLQTEEEQNASAKVVANELKSLTITLYKKAGLNEFIYYNKSKTERERHAPQLMYSVQVFNKLTDYLAELILKQTKEGMPNAVGFILKVAKYLCPLNGNTPDLNQLVILNAMFNSLEIGRLINDKLLGEHKAFYKQLQSLTSADNNYKNYHHFIKKNPSSLPVFNIINGQLTFALDRKSYGTIEQILLDVLRVKIRLQRESSSFNTNLFTFIEKYDIKGSAYLFNLSLTHLSSNRRKNRMSAPSPITSEQINLAASSSSSTISSMPSSSAPARISITELSIYKLSPTEEQEEKTEDEHDNSQDNVPSGT